MTFIVSFRIEGLAGRPGVIEKNLHRTTNVFWGLNGSGKTTLLKILDSALNNDATELRALPFDSAVVVFHSESANRDFARFYTKSPQAPSRLSRDGIEYEVRRDLALGDDWIKDEPDSDHEAERWTSVALGPGEFDDDDLEVPYAHSFLPIARIVDPARPTRPWSDMTPEQRFVRQVNQVWSRYSNLSLAEIRDVQQFGLAEILAILFGGSSAGVPTPVAEEVGSSDYEIEPDHAWTLVSEFLRAQRLYLPLGKRDFLQRYHERAENRRVVSRIQVTADHVEAILAPQRELQTVIEEMFIGDKHLALRGTSARPSGGIDVQLGAKSIPLALLSSGEKQLLHILLETLAVRESTIMIDEPELSLHVDWQVKLVESMRRINPDAQFLLATHSPELMIDIDPECVFEL